MARIRTIKPEFFTDEKLVEVSRDARLLFIGLWIFADDEGRMAYSPRRIKMQIFPADAVSVERLVDELVKVGAVLLYSDKGREILQVRNFSRHQRVNRPTPSKFPPPPHCNVPRETFSEHSLNNHGALSEHSPTELELEGELEVESSLDSSSGFVGRVQRGAENLVGAVDAVKKTTATPTANPADEVQGQKQSQEQPQNQNQKSVVTTARREQEKAHLQIVQQAAGGSHGFD